VIYTAARSSLSASHATILSRPNGRCGALASSQGANIQAATASATFSPLAVVFRDGVEVRADPRGPDSERFPILVDLRAERVTDYLALPLMFMTARSTLRAGPPNNPAASRTTSWTRSGR